MNTIGFIGAGNMAQALLNGLINAKLYQPKNIYVSDIRKDRLKFLADTYSVSPAGDNSLLAESAQILVLSVKPQNMSQALESIKNKITPDKLIISIAAGITVANITDVLGDTAIVRVMPNTPALIGQGASALFANKKAESRLEEAKNIFSAVGIAVTVDDESLIDVVTAVSGSGPAYYFLLAEEMIKAAIDLGLPEQVAKDLVLQTAKGAALLAAQGDKTGQTPEQLRRNVTSPGGTTEAALKIFEEKGFGPCVAAAIKRACQRSRELSN